MSKSIKYHKVWSRDENYFVYRIPGIIVTNKGTVIIYCEARRTADDWALMDIVMKRSEDHGKTFGSPVLLVRGTEKHHAVNNPVMVQDKNGRIHFLYCEDYAIKGGGVFERCSDDDGISWSEKKEITYATAPEYRNVFALGPGHGICTQNGTLIIPFWMVPKKFGQIVEAHTPSVIGTIYSDDNGETWALGEVLEAEEGIESPNETSLCQLPDGKIYLNTRCAMPRCRGYAIGENGYSGWERIKTDERLPDPCCFGSVLLYNDGVHPKSVLFVNCESQTERANVVLKGSDDGLKSWRFRLTIDSERGGYADVAADRSSKIVYVYYETDYGKEDFLVAFPYDILLHESSTTG